MPEPSPLPLPPALEAAVARLPAGVRDTLRASLSSLDAASTLERGPRSTIEPGKRKGQRTLDDAISLLRELGDRGALSRRGTLGEGGMGVVHLAEQRSLGREVAVKSVKSDARTPDATLKLLREAWVTGALEHPNVIPVHDVRLGEDGEPQIVLKKVEGKPWSELFADRAALRERFGATDPLDWNLRVLLQVASAIHHAHLRGIVHRDIKPENVMIGAYGEVYVVDWGLAVAVKDDGTGRFLLAADAAELAGTPCYMAPEMLGGGTIDARTDVFLLGATLYEIATGAPPRDGPNLLSVIAKVLEPIEPSEHMPAELSRILRRATAIDPAERYETADGLRQAIASFLQHRGSIQLAEEAVDRLTELRAISTPGAEGEPMSEPDRERFEALFLECRFGFQQALRAWPDNELAREGLARALEHRIEHELRGGNVAFAAHLCTELPVPVPELTRRVEAARARDAEERVRRQAFERDHDPQTGRRTRAFLTLILTALWVISPLAMWLAPASIPGIDGYPGAIAGTLALMGIGLGLATWARDSLSRTYINRQLSMTVRIVLIAQLALLSGGYLADIPFSHAHTILVLTWGVGTALSANAVDARLYPAAIGYLVGFLVLTRHPEWRFPVTAAANAILMVNALWSWARIEDDVVEPVKRRVREHRQRITGA